MHDFSSLIAKLESDSSQAQQLEAAFAKLSLSRSMSFDRVKSVAAKITILLDRLKNVSDMRREAQNKEGAELDDAGYDIVKTFLKLAFEEEEDLIVGIIADYFGISQADARHIPMSIIYDNIVKDKVVLTFLPQLAISAAKAQSNILLNPTDSPSMPIPTT